MMCDDVCKVFNVEKFFVKVWFGLIENWSYSSVWAACNEGADKYMLSMIDFYCMFVLRFEWMIVFNGDIDLCVLYEGMCVVIIKFGFKEFEGGF